MRRQAGPLPLPRRCILRVSQCRLPSLMPARRSLRRLPKQPPDAAPRAASSAASGTAGRAEKIRPETVLRPAAADDDDDDAEIHVITAPAVSPALMALALVITDHPRSDC